ncbi:MAG: protein-L-isoaspartate(D-aspartate) O-methyltransferase [Myxococcales bacterium]|nr:protein-L-isoaspartate(D-aspartate) O-methyltransferase [Myxococcales bacterium]
MWRVLGVLLLLLVACDPNAQARPSDTDDRAEDRLHMVSRQIEARDVRDPRVLDAMRKVPRHLFVPESERRYAYEDRPLPIGHRQTISQPYIVALMTELAAVKPGDRVLEVGTGSGYQAAVLAEMGVRVFSIEIVEPLAKRAKKTLDALGYGKRVEVRHGDGYAGWPAHAPFDAIVVTAAPPKIPEPLKQQLKVGGHLVIPVGDYFQRLKVVTRTKKGFRERSVAPVRFVPMTGKAQER